jgi:DNA-binding CsgD family transcriptional regulator
MPPHRIASQLDDRFRLLAGGPRTLLGRQRTLVASVAWSEALLGDVERLVFHRLAVFVGGFTIEAAEQIVSESGEIDAYEVTETVSQLVDKSLVQFDAARERYSLLETIRSFAMQRLVDSGAATAARDAHVAFYASWLERVAGGADASSDGPHAWWDRRIAAVAMVEHEWPNCASALEWTAPDSREALRLVAGLGDFWAIRQRASDSARYGMQPLLLGDRSRPEWTHAVVRMQAVRTNALDPDYASLRDEALRLAVGRNDRATCVSLEVSPLISRVVFDGPLDEHLAALAALREEARSMADWATVWNTTQSPALILAASGRVRDVDELVGDYVSARFLLIRSAAALLRGEVAVSSALAEHARSLVDARYGSTLDRLLIAFLAAGAALMSGDARSFVEMRGGEVTSERLPRSLFSIQAMARGVEQITHGDLVGARESLASAPPDLFASWRNVGVLAQVELALGDREAARGSAEQLRTVTDRVDAPLYSTMADLVLAECDRDDDVIAALNLAHRALATARDNELWPWVVDALETLGSMLIDVGRTRDAARLLRAAHEARRTMPYPFRFAHRAADIARAHEVVAGETGWEDGADLSLGEAVDLAQRMRGERVRALTGWESITPTEAQVIEQVVAGLTNPQIAERLLMSRATVKTHLVHVYAKLGISNRAELAAAATRRAAR